MAKLKKTDLNRAHKALKADARQRVAARGLLQFRADPETVTAVLESADAQNMPVGALLRQWIQERLILEGAQRKAPDLVERVVMLEAAMTDLKRKVQKK